MTKWGTQSCIGRCRDKFLGADLWLSVGLGGGHSPQTQEHSFKAEQNIPPWFYTLEEEQSQFLFLAGPRC